MKHLVDVDGLVEDEVLTQEQADEILRRSREGLVALAINIVLFLGILSVVVGTYLLKLGPESSIVVGSIISLAGILSVFKLGPRFNIIANAVSFVGTAIFVGGFVWYFVEELDSLTPAILLGFIVAAIGYTAFSRLGKRFRFIFGWITVLGVATHIAGILGTESKLNVDWLALSYVGALLIATGVALNVRFISALSIVAFASALAATGYWHATYWLAIFEPTLTILEFTAIALTCAALSRRLNERYARHSRMVGLLAYVWINMAMWVGSLWGDVVGEHIWGPDRADHTDLSSYKMALDAFEAWTIVIPELLYVIVWAAAILAVGIWAALSNRRRVFNAAVTFGAIHFYTQWFERLEQSARSLIIAGVIAIVLAWGIYQLNNWLKKRDDKANISVG